jgi:hypothetical protein
MRIAYASYSHRKKRYFPMVSMQSLVCIPTEMRADSGTTAMSKLTPGS